MADFKPPISNAVADPEKSQSPFFRGKNRVCEHFSHNPVFWCFELRKINWRRATGDLDIPGGGPPVTINDWGYRPCYTIRITIEIPEHISSHFFILKSNGIFSGIILSNIQFWTDYNWRFVYISSKADAITAGFAKNFQRSSITLWVSGFLSSIAWFGRVWAKRGLGLRVRVRVWYGWLRQAPQVPPDIPLYAYKYLCVIWISYYR